MTTSLTSKDPFFIPFAGSIDSHVLPDTFRLMLHEPHALCLVAAQNLQRYLKEQGEWQHNFGLEKGKKGPVIGKMFGVLVVKTIQNEIGYLAAFSGKLAGGNHHTRFVPPVFDALATDSFLNKGMEELTRMNLELKNLAELKPIANKEQIILLKKIRRDHSAALQQKLFAAYRFLNRAGGEKSLQDIFKTASYKNPPSGAGECAGPKLLQYAFQHQMKPLALAEFWWGLSPKSASWKHGHYYPCCREKCEPILAHMLEGINNEEKKITS